MKKWFSLFFLASLLIVSALPAQAGEPVPWRKETYSHFSRNESLENFLTHFMRSQGIKSEISPNLQKTISGYFDHQLPKDLFNWIVDEYDIAWYYDGDVMRIYDPVDLIQIGYFLETVDTDFLIERLKKFSLFEDKFLRVEGKRTIFLNAPIFYIRKVESIINEIDLTNEITVRVFPLKHAWADDRSFSVRGQSVTIPGVATILTNLLSGQAGNLKAIAADQKTQSKVLQDINQLKQNQDVRATPSDKPTSEIVASVSAYTRLNALIIRDYANKMPLYEKIVALLDVPMPLVEIAVTIVDVDVSRAHELGINWNINASDDDDDGIQIGTDGSSMLGTGLNVILGTSAALPSFQLKKFITNIRALEKRGQGRISSQPKVLTTSNIEAVLDYSQTFYVRVSSGDAANIVPITVGTLLRVTPQAIKTKSGDYQIKLDVEIEDGNVINKTELEVDRIPRVIKTSITTQAVIAENETLLVGGYHHDQISETLNAVPILSQIPLIGLLFQHHQKSHVRFERIFIITPRIIPVSTKAPPTEIEEEDD